MQICPDAVKYWNIDPDELEMMEEDKIYPPRFEIEVHGSHARAAVTALVCFSGIADVGNDTTELVLEPGTDNMQQWPGILRRSRVIGK